MKSLQLLVVDKILILCVDFNDKPAQLPTSVIYDRFFSNSGHSFLNYYSEVSYSRYIPNGEIHGWYRAPQNSDYYVNNNNGLGYYPRNAQGLTEDVINIASNDPTINWASFDNNNNGYIDNIIIIHSGSEAAYTGRTTDFWAHVSAINPRNIHGKVVYMYAMTSEYLNVPTDPQVSGVDCHEFGHLLGLPDLYDYSNQSNGVGVYSLMGAGSWLNRGMTPAHLDAWSKYILGYADTITDPEGLLIINDAETNSTNIKYTTQDPAEYFMIENRQKMLFDTYLPSAGMFIWHINESQPGNTNKLCFMVGLIQAD
jgi:immune inhibitor A